MTLKPIVCDIMRETYFNGRFVTSDAPKDPDESRPLRTERIDYFTADWRRKNLTTKGDDE